jgi:hypothetical protein
MSSRFILFALSAILLSGCIPLRQEALVTGPSDVGLTLCDDRYLLFGEEKMRDHKIVTQQSYIQSPSGKRYTIQVEPHQFDIQQKYGFVRDEIYPCGADGKRIWHWSNGVWLVHLVVDTNGELRIIDQQWKYWTFYYNPIIHGPPN